MKERCLNFCNVLLVGDNWRATATDPYGQPSFVAAVAKVFGRVNPQTLLAVEHPSVSVQQLAMITLRVRCC